MSIALIAPGREDIQTWQKSIIKFDPTIAVYNYPDIPDYATITAAVVWNHPQEILGKFPNLKWVSSLGAGANHILEDKFLDKNVVITKIVDKDLAAGMARYVAATTLAFEKDLNTYYHLSTQKLWKPLPPKGKLKIGILGLGNIGTAVAKFLSHLNFQVAGFSTSLKTIEGVAIYYGDLQMPDFLKDLDVLVNLLPLTPETRNFLNMELFKKLNTPAYLINAARGEHLVEEDLLLAIEEGLLAGACLDVFRKEPMPVAHPFWENEKITITPHIASRTNPKTASKQLVTNYQNLKRGQALINQVDREKGY